jgi:hypothetical protein
MRENRTLRLTRRELETDICGTAPVFDPTGAGENLEIEIKGLPIVKSVYPEEFFYFSGVAHIRI